MNLKEEDKIEMELENLIGISNNKIKEYNEHLSKLELEGESDKLDWANLLLKLKELEDNKQNMNFLFKVKSNYEYLEKYFIESKNNLGKFKFEELKQYMEFLSDLVIVYLTFKE
jgi:hypothetical protein